MRIELPKFPPYKRIKFGKNFFYMLTSEGFIWFRIFGYGLLFKDTKKHSLTFSEREGLARKFQIGKWRIKILKP